MVNLIWVCEGTKLRTIILNETFFVYLLRLLHWQFLNFLSIDKCISEIGI